MNGFLIFVSLYERVPIDPKAYPFQKYEEVVSDTHFCFYLFSLVTPHSPVVIWISFDLYLSATCYHKIWQWIWKMSDNVHESITDNMKSNNNYLDNQIQIMRQIFRILGRYLKV